MPRNADQRQHYCCNSKKRQDLDKSWKEGEINFGSLGCTVLYFIQVEFEARTPEERDLPGVISLLKQCFRGSEEVNLGALAQYVLKQRSVGSVVTQSPSDSTDDEDDDELGKNQLQYLFKQKPTFYSFRFQIPYAAIRVILNAIRVKTKTFNGNSKK